MRKIVFIITIFAAVLIFSESLDELFKVGDYFFNRGEYADALKNYRNAENINPDNPQVLWRLGAVYNRLAMNLVGKAQIDTLHKSNGYLTRTLKTDKKIAKAHCELAYNLAFMGLLQENFQNFMLANRIKEELDYALKLDSELADAYFLYGLWNRQVCTISILRRKPHGLGDASSENALENFQKAVQFDTDKAQYWLEYAFQTIAMGDTAKAFKLLKRASESPKIPINRPYIDKANEVIQKLYENKN
ncbi:tetratricopeptide repeat protein [bacterium]|nr:tetratricopeptide repeat protein [bacterium]